MRKSTEAKETTVRNSVKILAIGNSFSDDCMEHVYGILKDLGVREIRLGNLYIGGCPLRLHLQNAKEDAPAYEYRTNHDGEWKTTPGYKMSDAIASEEWDFIFTQQFSGESGLAETYGPLEELLAYVKGLARGTPKFGWQMTWAYANGCEHDWFARYGNDQATMYEAIVCAVRERIARCEDIAAVIPSGTAIQNARTALGDTLDRDGFHLSLNVGRYVAGLCVVGALTGLSLEGISFAPEGVDVEKRKIALAAATAAIQTPYKISKIQGEKK